MGILRRLLAAMAGLWLLLAAAPALAQSFAPGSTCHATGAQRDGFDAIAVQSDRWTCADRNWSIASERAFLRFDLRNRQGPEPTRFITRLTRFDAMRLVAIGANGATANRRIAEADMVPGTADWVMSTELPRIGEPLVAIGVEINQPRHVGMLSDAALTTAAGTPGGPVNFELLIAGLCGMLCVVLLFNFAFYRVLRARFLIWHGAAVLFMLVQTFFASGMVNRFADLPLSALTFLSASSFGIGVCAAMLFSADLIEPGKLDPLHRRLLRTSGLWVMGWTGYYLFADGPLRATAPTFYFASFIPVLAMFVWVMAVAASRASRAVRFQIAAWLPLMLTGTVRIASAIGLGEVPLELQTEQHISIALEIIITTFGVADRLMTVRRERDFARAEARSLEGQAERDPLTGLLNRRVIEERFPKLFAAGFRSMAVLDLDHFKSINDSHGHSTGDEVLRAVAEALGPDESTLAVRMGGEEFLLLMSGDDAARRAEQRRQAIATRIASQVPGLNRIVTASMGLVELPEGPMQAEFRLLYAHCDRLLYEAKSAGRNRTMSERMRSFRPPRHKAVA